MMKTILIATDFSDLATHAVQYGGEIARRVGAEVVLLYADRFEPPPHFTTEQLPEITRALERSKQLAGRELEQYARTHLPGVQVRTLVVENYPATAILDASESLKPDLIVLGTHGRSGMARFTMGSVAERVLHETDRPLLTVRGATPQLRRILCPVDDRGCGRVAHDLAGELSELFGATIDTLLVREDAPEEVIDYAKTNGSDLIVIGAEHRRFSDVTVLGTEAVRITRHAPVPVLTVIAPRD